MRAQEPASATRMSDRPSHKTIVYYCVATHLGGAERSMLDLILRVSEQSVGWYQPQVILPGDEGPLVDALREHGIGFQVLPMPPGVFRLSRSRPVRSLITGVLHWPALRTYLKRLEALVVSLDPALVHTSGIKCHLLSARLSKARPVLWHLRDILHGGVTRTLLQRACTRYRVHLLSNSYATALAFDPASENPNVVYNGIDTDRFVPGRSDRYRDLFGVGPSVPILGIVGVLQRGKGIDLFLESAASLRDAGVEARFVVVGAQIYDTDRDSGYREELEARIETLGLSDRVRMVGFEADPIAVMQGLDLLVSASVHPESFGRVVVEAQACGVPVVAAAHGGVMEIVEDRVHGRLFPPGDVPALVAAVRSLLEDEELRASCIAAGRERAVEQFGLRSYVAGVVRTYDRILGAEEVPAADLSDPLEADSVYDPADPPAGT